MLASQMAQSLGLQKNPKLRAPTAGMKPKTITASESGDRCVPTVGSAGNNLQEEKTFNKYLL